MLLQRICSGCDRMTMETGPRVGFRRSAHHAEATFFRRIGLVYRNGHSTIAAGKHGSARRSSIQPRITEG
ncbi:hypothetical protein CFB82_37615 [Burkholderia sp. HI2714]|nr:hypothetical protein CFB82_37615 [Burkholderia sp. HI2714]